MADGTVYDRGIFRKEKIAVEWTEQCRFPVRRCVNHAKAYSPVPAPARYPEYVKTEKAWWSAATAGVSATRRRKFTVLRHIIATDKTHHRMAGRHDSMYRNFGFFRCASRTASLWGWAACTGRLSRITRFTPRACNPRLSRCSSSPLSKNTDDELLRHR